MSFPPQALEQIAREIAAILTQRKQTLSLVETVCGGLIGSSLLSVPGASKFYKGGLTLYTLESRVAFAGWQESDIKEYRGPTKEICAGLARNVRPQLNSSWTLAESGTAGPTFATGGPND